MTLEQFLHSPAKNSLAQTYVFFMHLEPQEKNYLEQVERFIHIPARLAREGKISEALAIYETAPLLPVQSPDLKITNICGIWYESRAEQIRQYEHDQNTIAISVRNFKKVAFEKYLPIAVANVRRIIDTTDLSKGDELLLKNIAIRSFYQKLALFADPVSSVHLGVDDCTRTHRHESVLFDLLDYGFAIKKQAGISLL